MMDAVIIASWVSAITTPGGTIVFVRVLASMGAVVVWPIAGPVALAVWLWRNEPT